MKNFYFSVTRFLNTNMLSIFIGIVSGLTVNLVTGGSLNIGVWSAFACFSLAVLSLIIIFVLRQQMDDEAAARNFLNLPKRDEWEKAIDYKDKVLVRKYLTCFFGFIFLFVLGTVLTVYGKHQDSIKIKNDKLNNQFSIKKIILRDSSKVKSK